MVNRLFSTSLALTALAGASVGAAFVWGEDRARIDRESAHLALIADHMAETAQGQTSIQVKRAADGLFYARGRVNGETVRFIVDTGASSVVMSRADAERVGLKPLRKAVAQEMRTVSGNIPMRWAYAERLSIAGAVVEDVDIAVVDTDMQVALLGQNALAQIGSLKIAGDTLTIGRPD